MAQCRYGVLTDAGGFSISLEVPVPSSCDPSPSPRSSVSRRTRLLARVLASAVGLVIALVPVISPPAPAAAATPPMRFGTAFGNELMWTNDVDLAAALDSTAALGVDWIRVDLPWSDIQPDGPGTYRWSRFDRIFAAAQRRGLRVVATLAYTPAWARMGGCPYQSCRPRDFSEFAEFTRMAALRYSGQGLKHWEIWNEPNLQMFWYPYPDPVAYAQMLRLTTRAIKSVDSSSTVLFGGLAAVPEPGANIGQVEFLATVTMHRGTEVVDGVAFHPYTFPHLPSYYQPSVWRTAWNTIHGYDPNAKKFTSLRQVLDTYGLGRLPIWLTEYGAPTCGPGTGSDGVAGLTVDHVTESRQAAIATDAARLATADSSIGALFWYSERDRSWDTYTTENCYGLRRPDGSRKPAWYALRDGVYAARSLRPRA